VKATRRDHAELPLLPVLLLLVLALCAAAAALEVAAGSGFGTAGAALAVLEGIAGTSFTVPSTTAGCDAMRRHGCAAARATILAGAAVAAARRTATVARSISKVRATEQAGERTRKYEESA